MELIGVEPYSSSSGYGMVPMLESMRERLSNEDRQTTAAAQNTENSMDYERTRDGWLQEVQSMASRMAELAVLSNNGTLNGVDRRAIQVEFEQMQQDIQSITSGPYAMGRFNGLYLFQG